MTPAHVAGAEQQKRRPWLILTTSSYLKFEQYAQPGQGIAHGVPLSTSVDGKPQRDFLVPIEWNDIHPDGTSLKAVKRLALCQQARTLSELRFEELAGRIKPASKQIISNIRAGVAYVFGY